MDIAALLNPSSPTATDPLRSDARGDEPNRVSQQYSAFFHPDHDQNIQRPQLVHPQPMRLVSNQPQLGQVGGHHRQEAPGLFPIRSFEENQTRRDNGPLSNNNRVAPIDLSRDALRRMYSWEIGEPTPKGMRLTVPPYATPLEPPNHQRILIRQDKSAESLRQWLETSVHEPQVVHQHTSHPVQPTNSVRRRIIEPQPSGSNQPVARPRYPRQAPRTEDMASPRQPPRPAHCPVSQNRDREKSTPDNNEDELIARVDREVILTEFEDVPAHTAKCDLCNKRNSQGMSRCLSCGWQSCHPCTIARGLFRTHRAGGRLHTGPVRQENLVTPEKAKGKKTKAKKDTTTQTRKSGRKTLMSTRRTSRKYSMASTGDGSGSGSGSDREPLLGGAHNLYSLSATAVGPMANRITEAARVSNTFGQDHMASGGSRFHKRRVNDARDERTSEADSETRDSDPADPEYDPGDSDSQVYISGNARRGRPLV